MSHRSFVLLSRYHSGNVPLHIAEDLTPEELAKDYNKPPLELICIDGKTFRSYTRLKVCHLVHGYKTENVNFRSPGMYYNRPQLHLYLQFLPVLGKRSLENLHPPRVTLPTRDGACQPLYSGMYAAQPQSTRPTGT